MKVKKELIYLPDEDGVFYKIANRGDYKAFSELSHHVCAGGAIKDTKKFYDDIFVYVANRYKSMHIYLNYAVKVLKGRLPLDFEKKFFLCNSKDNSNGLWEHDPSVAFNYAKLIIKNRLPEEYEKGCNYKHYVFRFVKKGHKAEDILANCTSEVWMDYFFKFNYLPETIHNRFVALSLTNDFYAKEYFKRNKSLNSGFYEKLKSVDPNKTIGEFLKELM